MRFEFKVISERVSMYCYITKIPYYFKYVYENSVAKSTTNIAIIAYAYAKR